MIKLILLSKHFTKAASQKLQEATGKNHSEIKMLFCDSAADLSPDKQFVVDLKQEVKSYGQSFDELDLKDYVGKSDQLVKLIKKYDTVFFCGGYYQYLNDLFHQTGLNKSYKKILENGLVHIGASAGSMIASKEMKFYSEMDIDYSGPKYKTGLGLIPFYIYAHYFDKEKYTKTFERTVKKHKDQMLIPLTNNQGIYWQGKEWEII